MHLEATALAVGTKSHRKKNGHMGRERTFAASGMNAPTARKQAFAAGPCDQYAAHEPIFSEHPNSVRNRFARPRVFPPNAQAS